MTQNDDSWNYKGPLYGPSKKVKEQNNAHIKISESRRKLQHLIAHLKSFDKNVGCAKSDVCSGRTVKEITDYFEKISNKNEANVKLDAQKSYTHNWLTKSIDYNKKSSISSLPKTSIPYSHIKKTIMTKKGNNQRDLNLHWVWKEKILQAKGVQYKREVLEAKCDVLSSIRKSMRASFISCVMMLQYVM